ncbi:MAG TPA: histidine kinase, partial [Shewanella frigidimarina]|nr:histidine kinase [Shewanella frigidimarina]
NSSKTRFLAAASHDLMQPFNALTLFTEMLKQRVKSTELHDLATNIEDSLNVVESLLSDLVEISRLDSNSLKTETSQFAIDDLLSTLVNEFKALSVQQGIDFNYQISSCFVESDQRLLRRIIQNFLSNAFHYSPSGKRNQQITSQTSSPDNKANVLTSNTEFVPKVLLGVRRLEHALLIQVWDNGPGIPLDKQQAIFCEFERLELTREIPGLGLGLAICDRIAKLLDINISLHSEVGKGTCFSVEIPRVLQQKKPVKVTETAEDDISSDSTNITVMVIDNDDLMLKAISTLLSDWGCNVITAKDQPSAILQLANNPQPKLIIADYHLEDDKNGVDLVQYLLANHLTINRNQPTCVICSADPSEAVRQHTSSAQFSFVRKPLKAIALKRFIKQLTPE